MAEQATQTESALNLISKGLGGTAPGATAQPGETNPATSPPPVSPPAAPEYVSRADVDKLVSEGVQKALAADSTTRADENVRERFIREKMADLPLIYQQSLAKNGDPKQLAQDEQRIREQYKADFKKGGGVTNDIGGNRAGGAIPPGQVVGVQRSAVENIAEGLKRKN